MVSTTTLPQTLQAPQLPVDRVDARQACEPIDRLLDAAAYPTLPTGAVVLLVGAPIAMAVGFTLGGTPEWGAFALPLALLAGAVLLVEHRRSRHSRWVAWRDAARDDALPRLRTAIATTDPTTAQRMAEHLVDLVEHRAHAVPAPFGELSRGESMFLASSARTDATARLIAWIAAETCAQPQSLDRALLCPFFRALRARIVGEPADVDG